MYSEDLHIFLRFMEGTTDWRNVRTISLVTFVDALQFSYYMWSFWPYIQHIDSSIGTTFVGIIMAISGVGEAMSAPVFGYWSNRIGRVLPAIYTSIAMSAMGNGLYLFLGAFSHTLVPYAITLSRFLSGLGSGNRGCFRALVACNSQGADRAKALASSGGAALVGLTIGPAVQLVFNFIGPLVLSQYTSPALLAIAINVYTAVYMHYLLDDSLRISPNSETHSAPEIIQTADCESEDSSRPLSLPLRMDVIAVIICMGTRSIRMLATSNIERFYRRPFTEIMFNFTHAQALQWNTYDQAIVGVLTIADFLIYAFTNYTKWVSERSNCIIAIVGLFVFYCLTMPWPFFPGCVDCTRFIGNGTQNWQWCEHLPSLNEWLYYSAYAIIYGICLPMLNNSLQALYSRVLGHGPQGTMQGVNQAVGSIARVLGPLVMSSTFSHFGPQATWGINIGLLGVVICIWIVAYRRLVPLELRKKNITEKSHNNPPLRPLLKPSIMKVLLVLAALIGASLATDCLKCICNKESGCKPIGCVMDVGSLSCGYYQIKEPYYQDCGEPGKKSGDSLETAWKRCADDYNCSSGCVQAYVNRYKSKCPNKGSCEQMSRLHNGGPNGCNNSNTVGYWNSIKSCCGCS